MATIGELINLSGKRALITGAGGGLGRIFADTLLELGADLYLVDQPGSNLSEVEKLLCNWKNNNIVCIECNLEIKNHRENLIENIRERNSNLDILINNAAFVGAAQLEGWSVPFEQQSIETWRRALEVNLTAVFELSQAFTPELSKSSDGCIINVASIYGQYGPDWRLYQGTQMSNPAAYSVSKGGLLQLTRWLATTLAPKIRVNSISPGGISRGQPTDFVNRYVDRTPLNRMATEDDLRGAIAYLSTNLSSYVTGQNLSVDGGWGVW
jgi:NAD(P)-dependent dehydrogenase (short-subunit alcohol dehydrogenase family)